LLPDAKVLAVASMIWSDKMRIKSKYLEEFLEISADYDYDDSEKWVSIDYDKNMM